MLVATYGDVISTIGVGVSLLGFGLAYWQLRRTADASVATEAAIARTERRMALNHLLVLVPQFVSFEADLDAACQSDSRDQAGRTLLTYKSVANQIAAILEDQRDVDQDFVARIKESARGAVVAKSRLYSDDGSNVEKITRSIREEIGDLTGRVGAVIGRYRIEGERA